MYIYIHMYICICRSGRYAANVGRALQSNAIWRSARSWVLRAAPVVDLLVLASVARWRTAVDEQTHMYLSTSRRSVLRGIAILVRCSVLQRIAVCCSVLQ